MQYFYKQLSPTLYTRYYVHCDKDKHRITLYFRVMLLQCKYCLILINYLYLGFGFGLGLVICNYA